MTKHLAVIETHPVQYHAPVYRCLEQILDVPVTAIYGSDFSVAGYNDAEFGATFAWDTDLLGGYSSIFLGRVADGGPRSADEVPARGISRALERVNADAVLLGGYGNNFNRAAIRSARSVGPPLLFRGETTDHAVDRSRFKRTVRDAALRSLYGKCARLLYIGERSREHYERLGVPAEKLVFSPYCVDNSPFSCSEEDRARMRNRTRSDLGATNADVVLLFSGKLSGRKGVDVLVAATKKLPDEIRDRTILAFLGSGELQGEVKLAAAEPPKVRAEVLGFTNQSGLSPYYHAADLLVLPSLAMETWGLVVNEALLHGLPAVVSEAVGCAPDLINVGKTGYVAEKGSAASLADAIERSVHLIGDREIRTSCRNKAEEYSVRRAAEGIAQAVSSI